MSYDVARILVSQAAAALEFPFPVGWAGQPSSQPESQAVKSWGVWSVQHGTSMPAIIGAGSIGVGSHVRSMGLLILQIFIREGAGTATFGQAADIASTLNFRQLVRSQYGTRTQVTLRTFSSGGVSYRQGYRQENLYCEFQRDSYSLGVWGVLSIGGIPITLGNRKIVLDPIK